MKVTKANAMKVLRKYDGDTIIDDKFRSQFATDNDSDLASRILSCGLFDDYMSLDILISDGTYNADEAEKYAHSLPEGAEVLLDDVFSEPADMHLMTVDDLVDYISYQAFI